MFYSGIGSRSTPDDILELMSGAALALNKKGYILRSGGALGADKAFEDPLRSIPNSCIIFRPEDATQKAYIEASYHHPAWDKCNSYARALHARNSHIILGENLDSPVKFVLCWTPGGKLIGGTAQGIRMAHYYKIPVYNLFDILVQQRIQKMIHETN